jgi:mannose-6-phosphate isomerase-like protein (cupin superfamily)
MANFCDVEPTKEFDVVMKTKKSEAATMVLKPGESTGGPDNRHPKSDQWMYVLSGEGEIQIGEKLYQLVPERLILIEANEAHEVRNTSSQKDLRTLNIYAPPEY